MGLVLYPLSIQGTAVLTAWQASSAVSVPYGVRVKREKPCRTGGSAAEQQETSVVAQGARAWCWAAAGVEWCYDDVFQGARMLSGCAVVGRGEHGPRETGVYLVGKGCGAWECNPGLPKGHLYTTGQKKFARLRQCVGSFLVRSPQQQVYDDTGSCVTLCMRHTCEAGCV